MKFKCLLSGTIVEFKEDYDIKAMFDHPQYTPVEEVKEGIKVQTIPLKPTIVKGKK